MCHPTHHNVYIIVKKFKILFKKKKTNMILESESR